MAITTIVMDVYKPGSELKNKVVDISDSFNARVGDNQVRLVIKYIERGIVERMEQEQLTPFMTGFVGQPDEELKVTDETGTAVSYHGSSDDIIGGGKVRMDLPGTMFPQEGAFYGFFGLENSEGKRVTTNNVFFRVENDNPDMYFDTLPFRTELQKLLDWATAKSKTTFGGISDAWETLKKEIEDALANGNTNIDTYLIRLKSAEERLEQYEKDLAAGKAVSQADLDSTLADFKSNIQSGLDEINEFNESIKNLNVTDVAGGIPDYMMNTLNSAQAGIDKSKFNLIFATDYHYDIGTTYNPDNIDVPDATIREVWESGLRKVLNATSLSNADAVVFNGDNVDQPAVKDIPLEKKMMLKELHDFLLTATSSAEMPAFILKGNHDGNYNHKVAEMNLTSVITDKEWSQVYDKVVPDYGENRNTGANYFYKDFDDKKIRLIGLDTYDLPETTNDDGSMKYNRFNTSGLQQAQLNWLANTALQVPEGTTVVISMHHPIDGTLATSSDVTKVINHDVLMQIINDFVAGKSNSISGKVSDVPVNIEYTFKGAGTIAALLSGHFHTDGNVVKNGINFIQTRCSLGSGDNVIGDKRIREYIGTPLEDAFDIVTIDTTAKTIDLKRVGAGSEDARYATRHFNY
ncbi:metallophosphoesterase family protein [Pediococcus pentosaceus]|uniref:metallophosphoesterase family protein n=1 Tax=Pediococcus pentosaceus TaxID=1255 RepID=UPI000CFF2EC5|nr:metallophosphoesterase [Pediococcus pentosaceus]AVL01284.1 hypothetical protein PP40703_00045 [Pediococcus pentosaceus]AVL02875.1 hypothetical protein PP40703_08750 [Pediococcus pentosaceus]MBF7133665.1 metallophosphoesterase [Pediococcus pentosaceus]QPT37000.1 metallophosphoesterase [Pediococcus pentosaceus]RXI22515.1 capsid protein [Pediococcus pentosaceus]